MFFKRKKKKSSKNTSLQLAHIALVFSQKISGINTKPSLVAFFYSVSFWLCIALPIYPLSFFLVFFFWKYFLQDFTVIFNLSKDTLCFMCL